MLIQFSNIVPRKLRDLVLLRIVFKLIGIVLISYCGDIWSIYIQNTTNNRSVCLHSKLNKIHEKQKLHDGFSHIWNTLFRKAINPFGSIVRIFGGMGFSLVCI